jgi:drug/metabolite transporter (DMT)-like permease
MYGMIIPAVAGPIFWKEPIGILQIAGIVMMLASLWLIEGRGASRTRPTEKKWIPLAILAFILSGMAGVMEKIHQSTEAREERLPFVLVACAFMLAFSLSVLPFTKCVAESVAYLPTLSIAALSGLVIGFYSTVNLILSGKLDSMIYYPVANGGALILTVLASALLFKERMDRPKIIGTAIGLAGILCLSIPV